VSVIFTNPRRAGSSNQRCSVRLFTRCVCHTHPACGNPKASFKHPLGSHVAAISQPERGVFQILSPFVILKRKDRGKLPTYRGGGFEPPRRRTWKTVIKRFSPIIALVAACWAVFVINNLLWSGHLSQHGIIPRHLAGLSGILWSPFLHASFRHLAANTLPLLILGAIICGRSRSEFTVVTLGGILLGGGLTWIFARTAAHIGASGLIFCYFGYLASMAYFRRSFGNLVLSAVCIIGYGGMLKGIVPTATAVSWEAHLAGLAAGIALAGITSKLSPPPRELEINSPGLAGTIKR